MTNLKQKRFVDTDYLKEQLDSTTVEVEGSHIKATETKIGYTTDIEIHGNTVQDASNLADIRSVGEKVEGQELYEIPVLSNNSSIIVTNIHKDNRCISYTINGFTSSFELMNRGSFDVTVLIHKGEVWQRDVNAKPNKMTKIELEEGERVYRIYFYKHNGWDLTKDYNFDSIVQANTKLEEDKLTILSPTPLEKVGDVADRIIEKDRVWGVEKNITDDVIGASSFGLNSSATGENTVLFNMYNASRFFSSNNQKVSVISDLFEGMPADEQWTSDVESIAININNTLLVRILKDKLTTLDTAGFSNWLDKNNISIKKFSNEPTFIPLPKDQQIKLRTFANKTNISFLTEVEGYIKCKVPKSVGGTLESLVEKAKMTDDRLEILENVSEGQNMKYSTDKGIIHCTNTKKGRVNDLAIEGNTMVNYCRDGSKTLTLNGDINEVGTHITTTNAVNSGKVDVICEGNTLVNLSNTNRYTINKATSDTNLVITSNTNYLKATTNGEIYNNNSWVYADFGKPKLSLLKPNTKYTVIGDVIKGIGTMAICDGSTVNALTPFSPVKNNRVLLTTNNLTSEINGQILYGWIKNNEEDKPIDIEVKNLMILEGDWTNKEVPSEFFEGMKSVGQDDENGHKIEILSQNKNLCTVNSYSGVYHNKIETNIPCKKNTIYTLTFKDESDLNQSGSRGITLITHKTKTDKEDHGSIYTYAIGEGGKEYTFRESGFTFNTSDCCYISLTSNNTASVPNLIIKEIQIEEGSQTSYSPQMFNKKSITLNEPLRGLPNGVKDRIVKMNNKWYIERNCGEIVLNGSENNIGMSTTHNTVQRFTYIGMENITYSEVICDKFSSYDDDASFGDVEGICARNNNTGFNIHISKTKLSTQDVTGFKQWLQANNVTVVYQLATPLYEELTVEPTLTTYVDKTHISNNSVIPCDMKVKNSGYSTIIKPSTLYTVALDTNKSGEVKVNLGGAEKTTTNNIVTITTPSILVDDSLRISGKGLTSTNVRLLEGNKTNYIPSYFEGLKSSFEEKQGDNHIVEVISNNKNLIEWEDLSLYTPQKNAKVEKTTEGIRAYNRVTGDDRVFLQPFRVRQGSKVTISFDVKVDTEGSSTLFYLSFLDANFNSIITTMFPTKTYTTSFERLTKTFDVGNASYIRIELVCFGTSTGATYKNIMVTESSSSYTPHKSNKIQFSTLAPLRSVGDISDKLVYKDNKWMIERNIGIINFKDLGTWYIAGDNGYRADIRKNMGKFITDKPDLAIFSTYASTSSSWDKPYMGRIFPHATFNEIIVTRPTGTTLEEFHKSIQENEEFCLYVLREPYYEEIGEYRNLDSYDEGTTISTNSFIAPKSLSFNLASHMSNIVKDVQDDVSDLKTWRSEVFDSITHKKTFDSGFTTIEDTKEGVIEDVKLEGKTLVNCIKLNGDWFDTETTLETSSPTYIGLSNYTKGLDLSLLKDNTTYTIIPFVDYTVVTQGELYIQVNTEINGVENSIFRIFENMFNKPTLITTKELTNKDSKSLFIGGANCEYKFKNVKILVLEGDHTQNPPSYFEGLMSVGQDVDKIEVSSVNKNLFSGNILLGRYDETGNFVNDNRMYATSKFKIQANKTIVVNHNDINTVWVNFWDVNMNHISQVPIQPYNNIITPINCVMCSITGSIGATLNNLQIEYGTIATPYTPHQSDKKQLLFYNTETQTWEKPILREWDSIEKHSDGKYYYHQRSAEVVLNGSEDWIRGMELTNTTKYETLDFNNKIKPYNSINDIQPLCCDKFIVTSDYINNNIDCESIGQTVSPYNTISIRISNTKLSSNNVEGFKQWLQANNVTVVYQLAEEKVYECTNIELNSYDEETNVIVDSGAISPITTVSLTSNLPQVAENLKNRVRQLEAELYNYKVNQNLRQLRTFYKSDYANFGVATLNNYSIEPTSIAITPYGYDLFEIFKEVIAQGKDKYDRIELEEYIDFYLMTFVFDFDMVFELFDLLDANEDTIEDEPVEEEPPTEEEEDVVEDTPTILPNLPEDEATPIPLI